MKPTPAKLIKALLFGAASLGFVSARTQAQLVTYTVTGNSAPTASQTAANATAAPATDISFGSGVSNDTSPGFYDPNNSLLVASTGGGFVYAPDLATSVADNEYIGFTITPDTGSTLSLTSLDLSTTTFFTTNSSATVFTAALTSNVDGFGTSLSTINFGPDSSAPVAGSDVSLGSEFADLTTPTTFRLYFYAPGDPGYSAATALLSNGDVINLDGASTVPEPSTATVTMLGGLATLVAGWRMRGNLRRA